MTAQTALALDFVHPWDPAFGKAPFRVVRYEERVYQPAPGLPVRAAGACEACGRSIRHVFIVQGSGKNDKEFAVGSDCALKVHPARWAELLEEARLSHYRTLREGEAQKKRAAYEKEREARRQRYEKTHAALHEACVLVESTSFLRAKIRESARRTRERIERGDPWVFPNAWESELLADAIRTAGFPAPDFFGKKDDQVSLLVQGEGLFPLESQYGLRYLCFFRVVSGEHRGACLVWRASSPNVSHESPLDLPMTRDGFIRRSRPVEGVSPERDRSVGRPVFHLTGKIKGHRVYEGVRQVDVTRCKLQPAYALWPTVSSPSLLSELYALVPEGEEV